MLIFNDIRVIRTLYVDDKFYAYPLIQIDAKP